MIEGLLGGGVIEQITLSDFKGPRGGTDDKATVRFADPNAAKDWLTGPGRLDPISKLGLGENHNFHITWDGRDQRAQLNVVRDGMT